MKLTSFDLAFCHSYIIRKFKGSSFKNSPVLPCQLGSVGTTKVMMIWTSCNFFSDYSQISIEMRNNLFYQFTSLKWHHSNESTSVQKKSIESSNLKVLVSTLVFFRVSSTHCRNEKRCISPLRPAKNNLLVIYKSHQRGGYKNRLKIDLLGYWEKVLANLHVISASHDNA